MKRLSLVLAIAMFGLAIPSVVAPTDARAESGKPPVSILQARKVALARVPGTIVNEKLKNKKPKQAKQDKPWVWSIKIRARGVAVDSDQLVKIEINANTGEILKVKDVRARKPEAD